MGDVGSARYEPAPLPPCPTIRVLCYSNCQRSTHSHQQFKGFKTLMVGHGGSSAGSYLADPTSPILSHCAVIILLKSVAVHQSSWLALKELSTANRPIILPGTVTTHIYTYHPWGKTALWHIKALFDYSKSETSLLNQTVLLQTSPAVNANPTMRTDSNLEPVWTKPVPDSCVIKQSLRVTALCENHIFCSTRYSSLLVKAMWCAKSTLYTFLHCTQFYTQL